MRITELEDGGSDDSFDYGVREIVPAKAKRAIVGAGARILFYPTLLYNVFRNKIQAEFRWWDEIDEFLLLGAVPFPKDVPLLHQLGVQGVVTLNEPYETLVPSSLYQASGISRGREKEEEEEEEEGEKYLESSSPARSIAHGRFLRRQAVSSPRTGRRNKAISPLFYF
ncbi:hypothetical protein B296_00017795 [Ensete ventricosum]|uniref:Uncharacterized protein n=1 Tax=Ensete ventricosum TaxID=4639 RepID=A0A426Z7B1_ENSVE|nr:hypothetical protein B296_00017795 [Ensete ventricosum]